MKKDLEEHLKVSAIEDELTLSLNMAEDRGFILEVHQCDS